MTHHLFVTLAVVISALAPLNLYTQSTIQESTGPKQPASKVVETIYKSDEVDKEADLTNIDAVLTQFSSRMRCQREGMTSISAVLRKTRKVTDVKVETTTGCKIPASAIAAIREIKFSPALKNGVPVSQLYEIDMKQELHAVPNP